LKRPALADHVAVRLHQVAGESLVTLHDSHSGAVARIGMREWAVLGCADGSRDIEGIMAASAARGRPTQREHVGAFLRQLEQAGMLTEGAASPPGADNDDTAPRPLAVLSDYRLRCDGNGSCCRIYPTTLFSSLEVARARVLAPAVHDCGSCPEESFAPERGSVAAAWLGHSVAMIDGRCAFLSNADRCALHVRGGAEGKPRGCQLYPTTFVDDGVSVRVSVLPECRCVFVSDGCDGESLVADGVTKSTELDASVAVHRLGERILLADGRWLSRAGYLELANALDLCVAEVRDVPRWLWQLAHTLEHASDAQLSSVSDLSNVLSLSNVHAQGTDDEVPSESLQAARIALEGRLDRRIASDAWRHANDLARRVPIWMRGALELIDVSERVDASEERFYLRVVSHAHGWVVDDDLSMVQALRRSALRLWIARRLRVAMSDADRADPDRALDTPIALVEAASRAFAL
jgi:lysine-N-methylase